MKKNIYLYLFIFSLLINIFTYMYFTKKEKYDTDVAATHQKKEEQLRDSLAAMQGRLEKADYFSLEQNRDAIAYFETGNIDTIAIKVRDGVYKLNTNPQGNPLVQYPPIDGMPFTINQIKILNNRWIIADFTNGKQRGETLIQYFIEDDGTVTYETVETFLHRFIPY